MSLVNADWLEKNINKVKVIDCSWHMPAESRDPKEEFKKEHIPNAVFFDLDKNSRSNTDLPHMLPTLNEWNKIVSNLGISKDERIIIYDNSDVISSCRCWYNFIYFGHHPKLVSVLDGGFRKWKQEKKQTSSEIIEFSKTNYLGKELSSLVKDKYKIDTNISKKEFIVVDARSKDRFEGKVPDPRKNVKSGSIPNSICLPFLKVINEDYTFKNADELRSLFEITIRNSTDKLVFSCGSGVTACVLALAYSLVNTNYLPVIYDGSWAEYGKL
jgi:thiosulfate/3-mercaptopyruvate sulfurtransferase